MAVEPGKDTTEYKEAKSASVWGIVAMVLGFLVTVGGSVAEALGTDSEAAIICGAIIAVAGVAEKTLVSLGYIKGRSEVKAADDSK